MWPKARGWIEDLSQALCSAVTWGQKSLRPGSGRARSADRPTRCSPRLLLPARQTAAGPATLPPGVCPRAPAVKMPEPVPALVSGQVLPGFLLCSALLIIKMYVVAVITGQVRLRKKVRAALGDPSPPR